MVGYLQGDRRTGRQEEHLTFLSSFITVSTPPPPEMKATAYLASQSRARDVISIMQQLVTSSQSSALWDWLSTAGIMGNIVPKAGNAQVLATQHIRHVKHGFKPGNRKCHERWNLKNQEIPGGQEKRSIK